MRSSRIPPQGGASHGALGRSPVPELAGLHQVVLPTPWQVASVQIYLIEGDPLTLVDAGLDTPQSRAVLESALDGIGAGIEDIRRVILTHYHRDHLGIVQSLRDAGADLEVWAHAADAPMIEGFSLEAQQRIDDTNRLLLEHGAPEDLLMRQTARLRSWLRAEPPMCRPTAVDRLVSDGDRIPFKDFELEVLHAPGHTAGHILLHHDDSGTLLSGDHIMVGTVPYLECYFQDGPPAPADRLHRRPRFKGLPEYLRSVRRLQRRSFRQILSAQGSISGRPDRLIRDALLYYDVRVQRIERGLRRLAAMGQDVTAWDLWKALFPNLDPVTEMRQRMLVVIGALDALEESGSCEVYRGVDGVLFYRHA